MTKYAGVLAISGEKAVKPAKELVESGFTGKFSRMDFDTAPNWAYFHFSNFDGTNKELVIYNVPRDVAVAFSAWYTSGKNTWIFYINNVHFADGFWASDYVRVTFGA